MSLDPKLIALVADDDTIRARVRTLVNSMVSYAEQMMEYGTPQVKAALIKTALPAMLKEMKEEKEDESVTELRAQVSAMYDLLKEYKGASDDDGDDDGPTPLVPPDNPLKRRARS